MQIQPIMQRVGDGLSNVVSRILPVPTILMQESSARKNQAIQSDYKMKIGQKIKIDTKNILSADSPTTYDHPSAQMRYMKEIKIQNEDVDEKVNLKGTTTKQNKSYTDNNSK